MLKRFHLDAVTAAAVVSSAILGCGRAPQGPATVPVTGTVTFNGKPIEGANVIFHPTAESGQTLASQNVTDASGRFEMGTHIGSGEFKQGMVPGQYAVSISWINTSGVSSTLGPPKDLLPKIYRDPKTSGLKADVVANGKNDFTFPLTGEAP